MNCKENVINGVCRRADIKDADSIWLLEQKLIECPWQKSDIVDSINSSDYIFMVYEKDERICGYGSIRLTAPECELNNIAVDICFQKRGIASKIMLSLLQSAKSLDCEKMFLEVNSENKTAINMYDKLGFEQISKRKNYYGENSDALIYCKQI